MEGRPAGYPMFLRVLHPFHSLLVVTTAQHIMGILLAWRFVTEMDTKRPERFRRRRRQGRRLTPSTW